MEPYTVDHVLEVMGGGRTLSGMLEISEANCSQWIKAGRIPHGRAWEISEISQGKLKLSRMPVVKL